MPLASAHDEPAIGGQKTAAPKPAFDNSIRNQGAKSNKKYSLRYDIIIDFATANVRITVGENDYTAKVLVGGKNNGGMKVYDIIKLQPIQIEKRVFLLKYRRTVAERKTLLLIVYPTRTQKATRNFR